VTNELIFNNIELMESTQASLDCSDLENPMGERRNDALRLDFDRKVKVEFRRMRITSDVGLFVCLPGVGRGPRKFGIAETVNSMKWQNDLL
jgi:hypothetical protein